MLRRPHGALLPLRLVFGLTFLYAGLDKLLDPAFLQATGRTSIAAQMAGWVPVSPIGGLVQLALPYAVPIGLGIAVGEIGIGLGTVLGLAYRLAAFGGALLSTLFLLTASWAVRPFYLGNDLPYVLGWTTLLLAGSGGVLALDDVLARRSARTDGGVMPAGRWQPGPPAPVGAAPVPSAPLPSGGVARRAILRAAALGAVALTVAGVAAIAEGALGRRAGFPGGPGSGPTPEPTTVAIGSPSPLPTPSPTPIPASLPPTATPSPRPTPVPSPTLRPGKVLARIADVTPSRPVVFQDPFTSDPGVLLKLKDGSFVAFDAVCTHAGCTVAFELASGYLVCPCHGAVFDPEQDANAIDGPTFLPLMSFPIIVDTVAGTIRLAAE